MFEALKTAIKSNSYIDGEEALSNTCLVAKFYFGCHETYIILSQKWRICAQTVLKYFLARGPDTAYIEAPLSLQLTLRFIKLSKEPSDSYLNLDESK